MKNKNIEKALEISNLWKRDECESPSQDECIAYDAAIRMAEWAELHEINKNTEK